MQTNMHKDLCVKVWTNCAHLRVSLINHIKGTDTY